MKGVMLAKLKEAEQYLLENVLFDTDEGWDSKVIDYTPPLVDRLYRQWGDYRISLHRIHPCEVDQAFLHPHPWPAAFRVFGEYEVGFGYSATNDPPEITHTIRTSPGLAYEMTHPHAWHYVAPTQRPVLTIMVTGPLWGREAPRTADAPFSPMLPVERDRLRQEICAQLRKFP